MPSLPSCLTLLLAAAVGLSHASKPKAKLPSPDYAGVFLDACEFGWDSLTFDADSLRLSIRSNLATHPWTKRSGDTVFYGERWAFLRTKLQGKTAYLFGEWAFEPPVNWKTVAFVEVIPKGKIAKGKSYGRLPSLETGMIGCRIGLPPVDSLIVKQLGYSIELSQIQLREFDITGFNVGDLYRIKSLDEKRIGELEVDWRLLPDLTHSLQEMELEEKLQAKTGRSEFYLKDFEAIGITQAPLFIPLEWKHIKALELTAKQLEEMGAKARLTSQQVEDMLGESR